MLEFIIELLYILKKKTSSSVSIVVKLLNLNFLLQVSWKQWRGYEYNLSMNLDKLRAR